jgi:hypothetical protein
MYVFGREENRTISAKYARNEMRNSPIQYLKPVT